MLCGVNMSGAEFGVSQTGAFDNGNPAVWFPNGHYDYYKAKGFNLFRIPVSWDRLQPTLNGALDTSYGNQLKATVDYATGIGCTVSIDIHNYARRNGTLIGPTGGVTNAHFNDLWTRLANVYKTNPKVVFGLMNEPHDMATSQWLVTANAVTAAIRATGATNLIAVSSNYWGSPKAWTNGEMNGYVDSLNNYVVEAHVYPSILGNGPVNVVSTTIMRERLAALVSWCRLNNKKFYLGEWSTNLDPLARACVEDCLTYLAANTDVCWGWSWWSCIGHAPPNDVNTPYAINPSLDYLTNDAKIAWMLPYLSTGSVPTSPPTFTKGVTTKISNYWAFIPLSYDSSHNAPTKLFVWLHGCGGKSLNDVAMVSSPARNWIALAPDGREGQCWSSYATDGAGILSAIADIRTKFNIHPDQIYIGGYSSGGDIGYELMMKNPALFAGAFFENTAPNATAIALSASVSKKMPIYHMAHLSDTTYPITAARTWAATLRTNGFSVTLLEKAGNHWDADTGSGVGTNYDARFVLLPYLDTIAPPTTVDPTIALKAQIKTLTDQNLALTSANQTYLAQIQDQTSYITQLQTQVSTLTSQLAAVQNIPAQLAAANNTIAALNVTLGKIKALCP